MKRQALVIASPGEKGQQGYLAGTDADLISYVDFLKSPLGGAWAESEIVTLRNPSKTVVSNAVSMLSTVDYSFTAFCGHGRHAGNPGSTHILLSSGNEVNADELRIGAPKHTLVLDCCRVMEAEVILDSVIAKAARQLPYLSKEECRKYFDLRIQACATGLVVLHACELNETAGETRHGGYYSRSLVAGANEWLENTSVDTKTDFAILSVVTAHEKAANSVKMLSGNRQNADFEAPRAEKQFPFAVIA